MAFEVLPQAAKTANHPRLTTLMAALDLLEEANDLRPGGGAECIRAVGAMMEAEILAARSTTPEERLWKVRRLARAEENEWTEEAKVPLLRSIEADKVGS
jgi:hypothetical protein